MRSVSPLTSRLAALSSDGGLTWSEPWSTIAETKCEGSLVALPGHPHGAVLVQVSLTFTEFPGAPVHASAYLHYVMQSSAFSVTLRQNLFLHTSRDNGKTWAPAVSVYAGSAAYSALLSDGLSSVSVAFERDDYAHITFTPGLLIP